MGCADEEHTVILFVIVWFRILENTWPFQLMPFPTWKPPLETTWGERIMSWLSRNRRWKKQGEGRGGGRGSHLSVQIIQVQALRVENGIRKLRYPALGDEPAVAPQEEELHHIHQELLLQEKPITSKFNGRSEGRRRRKWKRPAGATHFGAGMDRSSAASMLLQRKRIQRDDLLGVEGAWQGSPVRDRRGHEAMLRNGNSVQTALRQGSVTGVGHWRRRRGQSFLPPSIGDGPHGGDFRSMSDPQQGHHPGPSSSKERPPPAVFRKLKVNPSIRIDPVPRSGKFHPLGWPGPLPGGSRRLEPGRQARRDGIVNLDRQLLPRSRTEEEKPLRIFSLKWSHRRSLDACDAKRHQASIRKLRRQLLQHLETTHARISIRWPN